ANNAYNNAKFLRRKGIEADVLCYDYAHIMAQPEWEDAVFDGQPDEYAPQWKALDLGDFRRPQWFIQDELVPPGRRRTRWFKGQFHLEHVLRHPSSVPWIIRTHTRCRAMDTDVRLMDIFKVHLTRKRFEHWFDGYD